MRAPGAWLSMLILAALVGLTACSGDEDTGEPGMQIEVTASDFRFTPSEVRVSANQRYELRFQNDSQLLHDWTIDEIPATNIDANSSGDHDMGNMSSMPMMGSGSGQLHVAAAGRRSATLLFTPTRPGEYIFYCTVAGHRAAGMEGRLIVG